MESKTKLLLLGVVFVTIIMTLILFGFKSLFTFVKWFAIIMFIVLFIGFIFWVVYTLFIKQKKIDLVALQSKKIVSSAKICKPEHLRFLYTSGDRFHESVKLGRITGFTIVKNYENENEYIFTFKKMAFPFSLFEDENILRCDPKDCTSPVGDVYIRTLAILKISEYYYLNKDSLNTHKVDETIFAEAKRGLLFLTLAEMKQITDKAMGLDAEHNKQIEGNKLIKKMSNAPAKPET